MTLPITILGNNGSSITQVATLSFEGSASSGENSRADGNGDMGSFTVGPGLLVVAAWVINGSAGTIESCKLDNPAGTLNAFMTEACNTGSNRASAAIYYYEASGDTYSIEVAHSDNGFRSVGVAVYLITDYTSATPADTDALSVTGTFSTSIDVTLDIPADGVAVFVGGSQIDNSGYTFSSATEDVEFLNHDSLGTYGAAVGSKTTQTLLTAHTETLSFANDDDYALAAASWS